VPRAGLAPETVVAAGAALADEVGYANVTMGLVAERVGVRTPSLYRHVDSLEALRRGISLQGIRELGNALTRAAAGRSGADAIHAFADAYRRWALDHPGRYAATVAAPAADDEEAGRISAEAVQSLFAILDGFGLRGDLRLDAARAVRSALHGFVTLEAADAFGMPRDATRSFRFVVDGLIITLRAAASTADPA